MTSKVTKNYVDINLDFIPHPLTGDITTISDTRAIEKSLYNLSSFRMGELTFQPDESAGISELLFELDSLSTTMAIENRFKNFIQRKDTRIKVNSVNVTRHNDAYNISVTFSTENVREPQTASIFLKRVR
jgi:phage baseplate assembly protein W